PRLPAPIPLLPCLQDHLAAACMLCDEVADGRRCLLTGDIAIVVDDSDRLPQRAQSDADVGIFGQITLIPAANHVQYRAREKDRIATKRRHYHRRLIVKAALAPAEHYICNINR